MGPSHFATLKRYLLLVATPLVLVVSFQNCAGYKAATTIETIAKIEPEDPEIFDYPENTRYILSAPNPANFYTGGFGPVICKAQNLFGDAGYFIPHDRNSDPNAIGLHRFVANVFPARIELDLEISVDNGGEKKYTASFNEFSQVTGNPMSLEIWDDSDTSAFYSPNYYTERQIRAKEQSRKTFTRSYIHQTYTNSVACSTDISQIPSLNLKKAWGDDLIMQFLAGNPVIDGTPRAFIESQLNHPELDFSGYYNDRFRDHVKINSETVVLIGHSESRFDSGKTKTSLRNLMALITPKQVPVVYLATESNPANPNLHLTSSDYDFIGHSGNGNHGLFLPRTKTVILSGGHLDLCLCTSLQGLIRNVPSGGTLNIVLPLETVYTTAYNDTFRAVIPQTTTDIGFSLREIQTLAGAPQFAEMLLTEVSKNITGSTNTPFSPNGFLDSISYFWPHRICPKQPDGYLYSSDYKFILNLKDSAFPNLDGELGIMGQGDKSIILTFASTDQIPLYLPQQPRSTTNQLKATKIRFDGTMSTIYSRRIFEP